MDLQRNEALGVLAVSEVGARYAVDPRLQLVAHGFDPKRAPLMNVWRRRHGGEVLAKWREPPASRFVIDSAGPMPVGLVEFTLISSDASIAVPLPRSELHAGVDGFIPFEFKFEYEIAVDVICSQERIGSRSARSNNLAMLHSIRRPAPNFLPAAQVCAVEDRLRCRRARGEHQKCVTA